MFRTFKLLTALIFFILSLFLFFCDDKVLGFLYIIIGYQIMNDVQVDDILEILENDKDN